MGSPRSRKAGPSLGEAALDRRGMLRPRRCHKAGPAEPPRCPQGCDTQLPTLQGEKSHTSHRNAHSEHQAKGVKLFTVSSLSLFFFFSSFFLKYTQDTGVWQGRIMPPAWGHEQLFRQSSQQLLQSRAILPPAPILTRKSKFKVQPNLTETVTKVKKAEQD